MTERQLEFSFKGDRTYVQGTDIYNTILAEFLKHRLSEIRISFHAFIHQLRCTLFITDDKEESEALGTCPAHCVMYIDDTETYLKLKECEEPAKPRRYLYDETSLLRNCQRQGQEMLLRSASPYTFIETVVAMNKALLSQLYPDITGKWAFTRLELDRPHDFTEALRVTLERNLKFQLLKSTLHHRQNKLGNLYFSVARS